MHEPGFSLSVFLPSAEAGNEEPWRVDWYGDLDYRYSAQGRRRSEPSVKLVMSRVLGDPGDEAALCLPDGTDHAHSRHAYLPVSLLGQVRVGDIWQDGQCIASPAYQVETFPDLRITPDTTTVIKAGLPLDGHYLLPLDAHPWHLRHTQAHCVQVQLPQGRRLIVPCLEIVRFYFGMAGSLLHRLFVEPFRPELYWTEESFDSSRYKLDIRLAPGMNAVSAPHIGRLARSEHARHAAARIHHSCAQARGEGLDVYPVATFPFLGKTTLQATGIWLPFAGEPDRTFAVFHLDSCSHPFPFSSLSYHLTSKESIGQWHSDPRHPENTPIRAVNQPKRQRQVTDADPGAKKAPQTHYQQDRLRFPDLGRKPVWRMPMGVAGGPSMLIRRKNGSLEPVSYGEPWGNPDVRQVELVTSGIVAPVNETGPHSAFVQEVIATFVAQSYKVSLLTLPGYSQPVFAMPTVVDEDGVLEIAMLFTQPDGHHRARQALFVQVSGTGGGHERYLALEGIAAGDQVTIIAVRSPSLQIAVAAAVDTHENTLTQQHGFLRF
ncbi:MAG: hypothetical protein PHX83_17080 [Acidobacteriia bacterium]|nr:hypothetical protein [Terriglobia bacterium]